jgi:peptidoglycan/xylan/chitin deacetylase (PgdA/CDA1 family)
MLRPATLLALLCLAALPAGLAAWGTIDDVRYKLKGSDGNRLGELLGQGQLVKGGERPGTIAFTFDDGPDHRSTPLILDQLDRYGIKAAFFVNGHRFHHRTAGGVENQAVLRDLHRRGHFIGNHTFGHKDITTLDDEGWRLEVTQVEQLVRGITGRRPHLFRPPFGRSDGPALQRLSREGYTVVMWNLDPLDWKASSVEDLLARTRSVLDENPQGGVLLLHDTNRNTAEAIGSIVELIEDRNSRLAAEGRPGLEIVGIEHYVTRRPR